LISDLELANEMKMEEKNLQKKINNAEKTVSKSKSKTRSTNFPREEQKIYSAEGPH